MLRLTGTLHALVRDLFASRVLYDFFSQGLARVLLKASLLLQLVMPTLSSKLNWLAAAIPP